MATEIYLSLPSPTSIRLLKLHGLADTGRLRCSLVIADLSNPPPYVAISYVCGAIANTTKVVCEGHELEIPRNLHNALLIYKDMSTLIWADAICIEQGNLEEKSSQVGMMGAIYQKARIVVIRLDAPRPQSDADLLFADMHALVNQLDHINSNRGVVYDYDEESANLRWKNSAGQDMTTALMNCAILNADEEAEERLQIFLTNPWFSRVWVLQEAGLSNLAMMYWGESMIPWDLVGVTIMFLRRYCSNLLRELHLETAARGAYELYTSFSILQPRLTFLMLLDNTRGFKATEACDKIFSLLSHPLSTSISWAPRQRNMAGPERRAYQDVAYHLLPSSQDRYLYRQIRNNHEDSQSVISGQTASSLIRPDYRKSTVEIYTDFAKSLIARTQSLEILAYVQHQARGLPPYTTLERPTWVPQWHDTVWRTTFGSAHSFHIASANKDAVFSFETPTPTTEHPSNDQTSTLLLKAKGVPISNLIGKIWSLTPLLSASDLEPPSDQPEEDESTDEDEQAPYLPRPSNIVTKFWEAISGSPEITPRQHYYPSLPAMPQTGNDAVKAYAAAWVAGEGSGDTDGIDYNADFHAYWNKITHPHPYLQRDLSPDYTDETQPKPTGSWHRYLNLATAACRGRKVFTTKEGYLGLGPGVLKRGDEIVVLLGLDVPAVVRAVGVVESTDGNTRRWEFVGECYVHGLMQGQGMRVGLEMEDYVFV